MSSRCEAHEAGCGSPPDPVTRQLSESSPAGRVTVSKNPSESDGGMCDALHQQSVMRASEDPGGTGAPPYISMAGCLTCLKSNVRRSSAVMRSSSASHVNATIVMIGLRGGMDTEPDCKE